MPIIIEPCSIPVAFQINGCEDCAEIDLNSTELSSLGRIVKINTTIKNICPERRVAVAVQLSEIDDKGIEYDRGLKVFTIPAHHQNSCTDVTIKCIHFIVPEDLDVMCCSNSICNSRNFKARVLANYIDSDFVCCDTTVTLP